jgi:hypothetical protein
MNIKRKGDLYPRVTGEYVLSGDSKHLGGWWYESELLHIIKCAENTIKLYKKENITDEYIKELDAQASKGVYDDFFRTKNNKEKTKENDYLYLILDMNDNVLKIGRSKNPKARIKTLQIATSHNLRLLFAIKGKGEIEKNAHEIFKNLRITSEWFTYDNSIIDFFENLKYEV